MMTSSSRPTRSSSSSPESRGGASPLICVNLGRAEGSSPLGGGGLEQGGGQEGGAANDHKPSFPSVLPEVGAPLLTSPLSQPPPAQGGGKGAASEKLTHMGGEDLASGVTPD